MCTSRANGTVNTCRMLDSLGRADRLPEVARDQRLVDLDRERAATAAEFKQQLQLRDHLVVSHSVV